MNYLKIFISLIILFNFKFLYSKILYKYHCPEDTADYMSCSNACVHDKSWGFAANFKVNIDKGILMKTNYLNGVQIHSSIYENCSIIDEENFVCEFKNYAPHTNNKYSTLTGHITMTNGIAHSNIFSHISDTREKRCFK